MGICQFKSRKFALRCQMNRAGLYLHAREAGTCQALRCAGGVHLKCTPAGSQAPFQPWEVV